MNPYHPRDTESPSVHLIINGSLGMTPGKIAAQTFQACQRLLDGPHTEEQEAALRQWREAGTRTITRIAETEAVFARVCREVPGALMIDEGMTEVEPNSPTVFASYPLTASQQPTVLKHKRLPLLTPERYARSLEEPVAV